MPLTFHDQSWKGVFGVNKGDGEKAKSNEGTVPNVEQMRDQ